MSKHLRAGGAHPVTAALVYIMVGVWCTRGLWPEPASRLLRDNPHDQELFEWWLAWSAKAVGGLRDPFVTHAMNAPDGVNAMANTSVLLPGIVMAPVTWVFGPATSFALLTTLALPLTAITTHAVLRRFGARPAGAFAGGLLIVVAPGLRSQTLAHLHMAMAFLVPLLVAEVAAVAAGSIQARRGGLRIGLLASAQLLMGEEWLAIAVLTCLAVLLSVAARCPPELWRAAVIRLCRGTATALLVAAPLVALPLVVLFAGPEHAGGSPFDTKHYVADLRAFVTPSHLLAVSSPASDAHAARLGGGITEQTAYLGWPVLAWLAGAAVVLRRSRAVLVLLPAALGLAVCAMGAELTIDGRRTGIALPWDLLGRLPLLDQALPGRIALAVVLLLAPVIACAVDRAVAALRHDAMARVALVATAVVVSSLWPRPAATTHAGAGPAPFRARLAPAATALLTVPIVSPSTTAPLRWEAARGLPDDLAGNYAITPDSRGHAQLGPSWTATWQALDLALRSGRPKVVGAASQAAVRADLRRQHVCTVAAIPDPRQRTYVAFLSAALGPPASAGAAPVWQLCRTSGPPGSGA